MDETTPNPELEQRHLKNSRRKRVIGILLVIAILYSVVSNLDLGWPSGFAIKEQGETCVETKGPKEVTDTIVQALDIEEMGFKVLVDEGKAVLSIRNRDNVTGKVRVIVYCVNGAEQGEQRKSINPGETEVFNFLDVEDCDLDYYIDPETVTRKVSRTVEGEDVEC